MCFHRCSLPLLTVSSGSGNPGGHYKGPLCHFLWLPKPEAPGCQVSEGFSALSTSPGDLRETVLLASTHCLTSLAVSPWGWRRGRSEWQTWSLPPSGIQLLGLRAWSVHAFLWHERESCPAGSWVLQAKRPLVGQLHGSPGCAQVGLNPRTETVKVLRLGPTKTDTKDWSTYIQTLAFDILSTSRW